MVGWTSAFVKPADAFELVDHDGALKFKLRGIVDMLEMTAAAAPRPKMHTARRDPVRRRFQHGHALREGKAVPVIGDARGDALAGNGIRHEDRAPVVTAEGAAAVRHFV